jgi:hypothetical protein
VRNAKRSLTKLAVSADGASESSQLVARKSDSCGGGECREREGETRLTCAQEVVELSEAGLSQLLERCVVFEESEYVVCEYEFVCVAAVERGRVGMSCSGDERMEWID